MSFNDFKKFLFSKNFGVFFIKNRCVKINPILFGKKLVAHSGKYSFTRSVFFIHNSTSASNLFLTKKIKPKPILKKKK